MKRCEKERRREGEKERRREGDGNQVVFSGFIH